MPWPDGLVTELPIPTPLTTAIINMKNEDDMCFKWAVARALNPVEGDAERITKLLSKQAEELNMKCIEYPVSLKDIDKFEKQNPSISINVFGFEGNTYPLRISKRTNGKPVNLLMISNGEKVHYCLIKNMSRLLSSQTNNHQHEKHYCLRCLNPFNTQESLDKHKEYCSTNEAVKMEMPEEGSISLSFKIVIGL